MYYSAADHARLMVITMQADHIHVALKSITLSTAGSPPFSVCSFASAKDTKGTNLHVLAAEITLDCKTAILCIERRY